METSLLVLLDQAIKHFHEVEASCPFLIAKNSVPILFSGNIAEYMQSQLKVVTVALNPSSNEFETPSNRYRVETLNSHELKRVCSAYFDVERAEGISPWFSNYEKILNGLQSSYFSGYPNRAMHSDLCSPIVTQEKWRRLSLEDRQRLEDFGVPLWKRLIAVLAPDIVLVSVAKEYRDKICRSWSKVLLSTDHSRRREIAFGECGRSLVAWGNARNLPFMDFKDYEKAQIGKCILDHK